MAQLAVSLLGPPYATYDGRPLAGVESNKVWALLAYLVLEPDRAHQREALIGLLWPEQPEAAARHNLRQALTNLRQAIHDDAAALPFLLITRTTIQFNAAADYHLDVAAFSAKLAACEHHAHQQPATCAPCTRWRRQAVALYRGDFLDRFFVRDSVAFEEWALIKREGLHQRMLDALAHLVAYYEQRSRYADATVAAQRLLELDPLREETHRDLMRLLAAAGQRSAALAQYARCRRLLQNEFGIEPEAETTALYQRIRAARSNTLVLVEHPEPFMSHLTNLPTPTTPLIGRNQEITSLSAQLKDDNVRLLTLTGSPGIGKTRLSLAVAAALQEDFDDGVWFVALAHIRDDALVTTAIAQALGVKEIGGQSLVELLKNFLRDRQLLLVLDNFEQLLDAAPLIAELLVACPYLKSLVTSRAALHVRAERQVPVVPLRLPDPARLADVLVVAQAPAVVLFVERAQAIMPGFALRIENVETVAAICRLLDGMPLAIELAAARSRALPPAALLTQLDRRLAVLAHGPRDLPGRQQTLRAAIGWSYDLLDTSAQALFARLGVFVGGCTVEAAETVCGDKGTRGQGDKEIAVSAQAISVSPDLLVSLSIFDGLAALVDQSLLQQVEGPDGEPRFTMLETIREYALERLAASGESEALRERHLAYYLALAEAAEPHRRGAEQIVWADRLEQEHDNFRAALAWAHEHGAVDGSSTAGAEAELRLAGALFWFWGTRDYQIEGQRWIEGALARTSAPAHTAARARALFVAGVFAATQSDYVAGRARLEESVALWRQLGDTRGLALALIHGRGLGWVALMERRVAEARALFAEGVALCRGIGDKWGLAKALWCLGAAIRRDDPAAARPIVEEGVALYREVGDLNGLAEALPLLGIIARLEGDHTRAAALLEESLALGRAVGDKYNISEALLCLGDVAQDQGDYARALVLYQESMTLARLIEGKEQIAGCLVGLGGVAGAAKQAERAARLLSAAETLLDSIGLSLAAWPELRADFDRYVAVARAQLDEATFIAAWEQGHALSLEQAIAAALEL